MKKILILLVVAAISIPSFAGLKEKDVIGKWSYKVETPDEILKGTFSVEKKDGKLAGEVNTDNAENFLLSNIEIRDNNVLYFELEPEYEVMKVTLTIDKNKYSGMLSTGGEQVPLAGEKIE